MSSRWGFIVTFLEMKLLNFFTYFLYFYPTSPSFTHAHITLVDDPVGQFSTADKLIHQLDTNLTKLLSQKDFRYYRINLNQKCPFWTESMVCFQRDCQVDTLHKDDHTIPLEWKTEQLSKLNLGSSPSNAGFSLTKKCTHIESEFCMLDELTSSDAVYVDLLANPERYTGYKGESAARIWTAIYDENCFDFMGKSTQLSNLDYSGGLDKSLCLEKRLFYRLISGLHASISTHICESMLNQETGEWYSDLECFEQRVGGFQDRIANVYFTYLMLSQAIQKIGPYLKTYTYCSEESTVTRNLIDSIVNEISKVKTFDDTILFSDLSLKEEFKSRFRNISTIMDCVACEKCRLWGKLQISGIATALRILFSYTPKEHDFEFTRTEIVALVNVYGRISATIKAIHMFTRMRSNLDAERETKSPSEVVVDEIVVLVSTVVTIFTTYYFLKVVKRWVVKDKI